MKCEMGTVKNPYSHRTSPYNILRERGMKAGDREISLLCFAIGFAAGVLLILVTQYMGVT